MAASRSSTLKARVRGDLAVFTEPAFKVERITYPVMTPSAARGILEAILWKPAMRWRVERILVLKPMRFIAFRRNEVNRRAAAPAASVVAKGGSMRPYFADEDRAQRNTVALRDVDYVIEAHFELTNRRGPDDNVEKFVEMFERRVAKGQHFQQPYLGCREFAADVLPADGAPRPIDATADLGHMLWDIEYAGERNRPIFFPAAIRGGILEVPPDPETPPGGGATAQ